MKQLKNIVNIILAIFFLILGLWNGIITFDNFRFEGNSFYHLIISTVSIIIGLIFTFKFRG